MVGDGSRSPLPVFSLPGLPRVVPLGQYCHSPARMPSISVDGSPAPTGCHPFPLSPQGCGSSLRGGVTQGPVTAQFGPCSRLGEARRAPRKPPLRKYWVSGLCECSCNPAPSASSPASLWPLPCSSSLHPSSFLGAAAGSGLSLSSPT